MNYNLLILAGNLTRDPELKYTPSQVAVVDFGIAVNKKWTGKGGEKKETTLFIDCVAFKGTAETINKYLSKGDPILLSGELQFDSWEKDGQKRSKHKIMVNSFQFVGEAKTNEPKKADDEDIPY